MTGIEPFTPLAGPIIGSITKPVLDKVLQSGAARRHLQKVRRESIREVAASYYPASEADETERAFRDQLIDCMDDTIPPASDLVSLVSAGPNGIELMTVDIMTGLREVEDFEAYRPRIDLQGFIENTLRTFTEKLRLKSIEFNSAVTNTQLSQVTYGIQKTLEHLAVHVGMAPASTIDLKRLHVMASSGWQKTLERLYPEYDLIRLFGTAWPMAVLPAKEDEFLELESALGKPPEAELPEHLAYSVEYYPPGQRDFDELIESVRTDPGLWNDPAFLMDSIDRTPTGSKISCRSGWYIPMKVTCDMQERELIDALAAEPDWAVGLDRLPRRAWAHEQCQSNDPLVSGRGRAAAVSIATTILMKRKEGGWRVLLAPRSQEVAAHAFFNHVLPAGIFAPLDWHETSLKSEYSVLRNLLREYSEELFDNNEAKHGEGFVPDITMEPEVRRLLAERGKSLEFYYTGISLNLLSLRPEICLMILVKDPTWLHREARAARNAGRSMTPNWEILKKENHHLHRGRYALYVDLDEEFQPTSELGNQAVLPGTLVGNAAASMYLAFKLVTQIRQE